MTAGEEYVHWLLRGRHVIREDLLPFDTCSLDSFNGRPTGVRDEYHVRNAGESGEQDASLQIHRFVDIVRRSGKQPKLPAVHDSVSCEVYDDLLLPRIYSYLVSCRTSRDSGNTYERLFS